MTTILTDDALPATSAWFKVHDGIGYVCVYLDLTHVTTTSITMTMEASPDCVDAYALDASIYVVTLAVGGSVKIARRFPVVSGHMRLSVTGVAATTDTVSASYALGLA